MITFKQFLEGYAEPNTEEFANFNALAKKLLEVNPSGRLLIKFVLYCAQSVLRYNNATTFNQANECIRLLQDCLIAMDSRDKDRLEQLRTSLNAAADAAWAAGAWAADAAANAAWAADNAINTVADVVSNAIWTAVSAIRAAARVGNNSIKIKLMNYGRQLLTTIKDKSTIRPDLQQIIQEIIDKEARELTRDDIRTALIIANDQNLINNLIDHMTNYIGIAKVKDFQSLVMRIHKNMGNRLLLQNLLRSAL